jgi:hypothetical protein
MFITVPRLFLFWCNQSSTNNSTSSVLRVSIPLDLSSRSVSVAHVGCLFWLFLGFSAHHGFSVTLFPPRISTFFILLESQSGNKNINKQLHRFRGPDDPRLPRRHFQGPPLASCTDSFLTSPTSSQVSPEGCTHGSPVITQLQVECPVSSHLSNILRVKIRSSLLTKLTSKEFHVCHWVYSRIVSQGVVCVHHVYIGSRLLFWVCLFHHPHGSTLFIILYVFFA